MKMVRVLHSKRNKDFDLFFGLIIKGENEIDSKESVEVALGYAPAPNCLLCEEFIKIAEKRIGKHTTKVGILIIFCF